MDSQDLFERGRKELEELLNREISATGDVRSYEIQCCIERMTEEARKIPSEEVVAVLLEGCVPEVVESDLKRAGDFIYVRTDQEYFIGRGSHQAALDLRDGLVAKGSIQRGTTSIRKVMEKYPAILPFCCGPYRFIKETVDQLGSFFMGTKIVVPKVSLYHAGWDQENNRVVVSPDVYNASYRDLVKL